MIITNGYMIEKVVMEMTQNFSEYENIRKDTLKYVIVVSIHY